MQLEVVINDVTHVVTVKEVDLIAFERHYGIPYDALSQPVTDAEGHAVTDAEGNVEAEPSKLWRLEHLWFLAWNACRRAKLTDGLSFDDWLDEAPDVDSKAEAPLGGPSASS